jgi:hypothetical protein
LFVLVASGQHGGLEVNGNKSEFEYRPPLDEHPFSPDEKVKLIMKKKRHVR